MINKYIPSRPWLFTSANKRKFKKTFLGQSGTFYILLTILVLNFIIEAQTKYGFNTLQPSDQIGLIGLVISFVFVSEVYGGERIVEMIYNPKWAARLLLEPSHNGNFDVLVGTEEAMDKNTELEAGERIHTKPAGPNGIAEVEIIREQWIDETGTYHVVPTWRGLKDPIDVEKSEANIEYNTRKIKEDLDEARQIKKEGLIFKQTVEDMTVDEMNKYFSDKEGRDNTESIDEVMDMSYSMYDPFKSDVDGVAEDEEEEENEEDETTSEENETNDNE